MAHGCVHQPDVANSPIAGAARFECSRGHDVDNHLTGLDVPALWIMGEAGGARQHLNSFRHRVVGRETGHEQTHAQLRAKLAEDALPVAYKDGIGPFGPVLFFPHKFTDSWEGLVGNHAR